LPPIGFWYLVVTPTHESPGVVKMIDTAQSNYPADMLRAAHQSPSPFEAMADDLVASVKGYAREKPVAALCWALGIGFILGWKLKPW
jgi:hypothetical protein